MRIWISLLCMLWCVNPALGYLADQNLFFLAGQEAALSEGDMYHRAVYYIAVEPYMTEPFYIRIFDADLAGAHDRWQPGSEVRYRIYGADAIAWDARAIDDPLADTPPLAELTVGDDNAYDDQWRTIAELHPSDGEARDGFSYFQLVVDGLRGRAVNKYQIFVSNQDKDNTPIAGTRITSPVVMLYLPSAPGLATQLRFTIPDDQDFLEIVNFDADLVEKETTVHFETQFTQAIPIESSKNEEIASTKIDIHPEDRGKDGALVLRNPKQSNHIQFWILDQEGRSIDLELPTFTGPDNHLPTVEFSAMPLSECRSILLDASASSDEDFDELDFEWRFPDGTRTPGSRIVHEFDAPGVYDVTLIVSDRSGFVANSARMTRSIAINQPPTAVITTPETVTLDKPFTLDASNSRDEDGQIVTYLWNLGDGAKAEGPDVTHTYTRPGTYEVTLIVEDDSGSLCSQARARQWIRVNAAPVPRLNVKSIAAIDEVIDLNADGSIDSDGEIRSYAWDFGDGAAAEGLAVTHAWAASGEYTVSLTVTDDAGQANSSATIRKTITINEPPVPDADYREVIAAQESVPFDGTVSVDPDGSIRQYVWNMGDGAEHVGGLIRHAYEAPGEYIVTLTVTDNTDTLNNTVSATFPVRVNFPPEPAAGHDQVVNSSEVFFDASASTDQDDPIIAYQWDFGDSARASGPTVSHVYALPGTYTATLTVTDASGTRTAVQSDTLEVVVNHPPIADAGGAQVVAPGDTVLLDGSFSEDPDGEMTAYRWDVAPDVTLEGDWVEHVYERPGRYQARLTVTDDTGAESVDYAVITVNARPTAALYPLPRVAPNQLVPFNGTPSFDPDGSITQATWEFGDDAPSQEGRDVQHQFSAPGRYVVTLTVTDDSAASNNSHSVSQTIEVNYPPQAEAGADVRTCSQTVVFDGSKSTDPDGDALQYFWDFGDGTRGEGRRVEHDYRSPGIFPVTLTVADGHELDNSIDQATLTAYVNAPPEANIKLNSETVCAGELVLFDAGQSTDLEQGLLRYQWDLGDGVPVEGINPVREYTEGGDYRIRLNVTDDSELACNAGRTETMLRVIDAPIARAGEPLTACANMAVQFDGSASTGGGRRIKSYEWEFGDGQLGVGVKPAHVYAEAGDYVARLLITVAGDGQCSNVSETEVPVRVMAAPVARFQVQKAACAGESLAFDGSASTSTEGKIASYAWDFGDGATGSGETATHTYDAPGAYQAKLLITSDTGGQCRTSEYVETVTINAVPEPRIQVASAGQEAAGGEQYATEPYTMLHFSGADSVDSDGFVRVYAWDFGDGQKAEGAFVTHQYAEPGAYTVTLQTQDNSVTACNTVAATMRVDVREPAQSPIQGPDMVCVGQPFEFSVDAAGREVAWRLNTGETAEGATVEQTFDTPGVYQLQARIGIDWMPAKIVTAFRLPEMAVPPQIDVYPGDPVVIRPVYDTSTDLPLQFQWDMGDGTEFDGEQVEHQYAEAGEYAARLRLAMQGGPECLHRVYPIAVTVYAPPEVTIQAAPQRIFTGGAHDAVTFEALLQDEAALWNYAWDFGDGATAIGRRVSHAYRQSGAFTVTVTLTDPLLRTAQTYVFTEEVEVNEHEE